MSETVGALVPTTGPNGESKNLPLELADLAERASQYAKLSKAPNTKRAYEADWRAFVEWCGGQGLVAMPAQPEAVLAYLVDHAGKLGTSTLQRKLTAIRVAHRCANTPLDTSGEAFRDVWRGIRRAHASPPKQKAPLTTTILRRALLAMPYSLAGFRDCAILLIAFAGALRRSELASLEISYRDGSPGWIEEGREGLIIHLGRSKGDQEGAGAVLGIPRGVHQGTCPVVAYRVWLDASGITSGPAFRRIDRHGRLGEQALTGASIALIVKRAVTAASMAEGMTSVEAAKYAHQYAGHSLRAGHATMAATNDAPGHAIQQQLRHRKFDTTAAYIRLGRLFKQNSGGSLGL